MAIDTMEGTCPLAPRWLNAGRTSAFQTKNEMLDGVASNHHALTIAPVTNLPECGIHGTGKTRKR